MGMDGDTRNLLKHYGIDEKKPTASPQLLKRIIADIERYKAAFTYNTIHNGTEATEITAVKESIGYKLVKGQSSLSGRSYGRSSGPVKKSGANKRSGGGREHGECLGASSRTNFKAVEMHTVRHVETKHKVAKNGDKDKQLKRILDGYIALLNLLK